VLRIWHTAYDGTYQHKLLDDLRVVEGEIDGYFTAVGTSDNRGVTYFQAPQQGGQIVRRRMPLSGRRGASIPATIVADGVKVPAELRPNVIPNGGIEHAIVDEYDGLR
jgi:hypothetical protein